MHAVVVKVTVPDVEESLSELREQVVPRIAQQPGFVAGYWLRPADGKQGLSIVVFESESAAQAASAHIRPPRGVSVDSVEVREVVASA